MVNVFCRSVIAACCEATKHIRSNSLQTVCKASASGPSNCRVFAGDSSRRVAGVSSEGMVLAVSSEAGAGSLGCCVDVFSTSPAIGVLTVVAFASFRCRP